MVNYNVILAGDVHRELAGGIKRTIMSGIATGKGTDDIVRDLGQGHRGRDSFRQAGTRVFSKAQYRIDDREPRSCGCERLRAAIFLP